ncbi:MAG: dTDP-4-dehydrorhamnose reductase [Rickettsiales bacterium]|nr:dTDP-4-dehydrorhamnose reductase [Rickettsiales bacterium]
MKNILIIGADGMFGSEAAQLFEVFGYKIIKANRASFDITDLSQIRIFLQKNPCDLVINSAAYTKVDDAESNREAAFVVNAEGAKNIAIATNEKGIPLVFISTDYVFDGSKKTHYLTSDVTNPATVYGASKLLGEQNTVKENKKSYIVRTSWLYGKNGKNFVNTMLDLSKKNNVIKVVNDQFGCPTSTHDLALGIRKLIEEEKPFGIYHICGSGVTSWYNFAKKIFEIAKVKVDVVPVTTAEFPRPAKRPEFSAMDNDGICDNWEESLRKYLLTFYPES